MPKEKFETPEAEVNGPKIPDSNTTIQEGEIKNVYNAEEIEAIFNRCIGGNEIVELPEGSKSIAYDRRNAGDIYGSTEELYLGPDRTLYHTHTPSNGRYGVLRAKKWNGTYEDWLIWRFAEPGEYFNVNKYYHPKELS